MFTKKLKTNNLEMKTALRELTMDIKSFEILTKNP